MAVPRPWQVRQTLERGARRVLERASVLHWDRGGAEDAVLLLGSGRSGTTWVGQLLHDGNAMRDVFEPFHALKTPALRGRALYPYARPSDRDAELQAVYGAILAGRVRGPWTDRFNRRRFARKRLIKDIRMNAMLPWLSERFPSIPRVWLVRHPCAVVESRLALGWDSHLDDYLAQPAFVEDHLDPHVDRVRAAQEDPLEAHAVSWCLENLAAWRCRGPKTATPVFFERLKTNLAAEAERLCVSVGLAPPRRLERLDRTPSPLRGARSPMLTGADPVTAWRDRLSASQVDRVLSQVSAFGLDRLYDDAPLPKPQGLAAGVAPAALGGETSSPERKRREAA